MFYGFFGFFLNKQKGAAVSKKLLESAIANAEHNIKADARFTIQLVSIVNQGMR